MKTSAVCVVLILSIYGVQSEITGLYTQVESCVKELGLDLTLYAKMVDAADDDGVISSAEMEEVKAGPGGPCLLRCVLTHQGYFKTNGEMIVGDVKIDLSSCDSIKSNDMCDRVSRVSICVAKLLENAK